MAKSKLCLCYELLFWHKSNVLHLVIFDSNKYKKQNGMWIHGLMWRVKADTIHVKTCKYNTLKCNK